MVSFLRRREPASSMVSTFSFISSMISFASGSTYPSKNRFPFSRAKAIFSRIFSSVFFPNPSRLRIFPCLAACSKSSKSLIFNSWYNDFIFFGPSVSTAERLRKSTGISFFNSFNRCTDPVLRNSSISSAVLSPTPGMSCSFPS